MPQNNNYLIPPVSNVARPAMTIPNQSPGQQTPQPQTPQQGAGDNGQMQEQFMILIGGLVELLIQNGTITEEDLHNAIAGLQVGGNPNPNPKDDQKGDEENDKDTSDSDGGKDGPPSKKFGK